jgi:hypothetical protein
MVRPLSITIALALFAGFAAGCASEDPKESETPRVDFRGTYRASGDGHIDMIGFDDDGTYVLAPSGCHEESCGQTGTYSLDAATTVLSLTDAKTGATRSLPVEILDTVNDGSAGLLAPRSLVGSDQKLTDNGQELVRKVQRAVIDGQPSQLVAQGVLRITPSGPLLVKPECTKNIPSFSGEAAAAAWWKMCPQGTFTPVG